MRGNGGNHEKRRFSVGIRNCGPINVKARNEGGKGESNWDAFVHDPDKNPKGITGDVANDFYHRYKEDIELLAKGNQNTFRFSLSWSRIIPSSNWQINPQGVAFYRSVLEECRKHGIAANVTLLHYDIPQWIEAEGGYLNDQFPAYFARYAGMVFDLFGDSIPYYVTINEITHNANCAYLQGKYPPNHHSVQELCHVGYNLVIAHARAVAEFRKRKLNSKIGIVHTTNTVQTLLDTEEYRIARHRGDLFKNLWVTDPAILGHFPEDLPGLLEEAGIDLSFVKAEDLKLLSENTIDFLGQNCYTRTLVKPYVSGETNYYRDYEGKGEVLERLVVKTGLKAIMISLCRGMNGAGKSIIKRSMTCLRGFKSGMAIFRYSSRKTAARCTTKLMKTVRSTMTSESIS